MEEEYKLKETEFLPQISPVESDILLKVKEVIVQLDLGQENGGFKSWPIDMLIRAREKLSRYSEPLGEFITEHETKSDYAYIWRKGMYAMDWIPLKSKFEKPTISDVESVLDQKYLNEQLYSMFHRRRADLLIREIDSIDRIIRTIDHQIRQLERQWRLKTDTIE